MLNANVAFLAMQSVDSSGSTGHCSNPQRASVHFRNARQDAKLILMLLSLDDVQSRRIYNIMELKWVQLTFSGSQVFWEGESLEDLNFGLLLVLLVFKISHHEIYRHRVFTGSDGKEYKWDPANAM